MARAKALSFAPKLGFTKAVLEGDSLLIIKALRDDGGSFASHGLLVEDVKFFFQCFVQLLCSSTKRESNSVAHSLARYVSNILDFSI